MIIKEAEKCDFILFAEVGPNSASVLPSELFSAHMNKDSFHSHYYRITFIKSKTFLVTVHSTSNMENKCVIYCTVLCVLVIIL